MKTTNADDEAAVLRREKWELLSSQAVPIRIVVIFQDVPRCVGNFFNMKTIWRIPQAYHFPSRQFM